MLDKLINGRVSDGWELATYDYMATATQIKGAFVVTFKFTPLCNEKKLKRRRLKVLCDTCVECGSIENICAEKAETLKRAPTCTDTLC